MKFLGPPSSGSIAGTTSSHNRAGQYTRNRRAPTQPVGTGRRAFMRAAFGSAAAGWGSLTASQQAAWATYGNSHPITDALGQSIKLTGQQAYVQINAQLLNVGSSATATPPAGAAIAAPVLTVFTVVHGTPPTITITLTASGASTDHILVAFSRPQSGGVSFCKTFWQQTVIVGNATTVTTPGVAYNAQFGSPAIGQRVFIKLTPVNAGGETGVPVIQFATAT